MQIFAGIYITLPLEALHLPFHWMELMKMNLIFSWVILEVTGQRLI